jgi:hypothetical protein
MDNEYKTIVEKCAQQGIGLAGSLANAGIFEPLYLYGRESVSDGNSGELVFVRDSEPAPTGMKLVTGEGLRGNVPYVSYFQWIYERARRFPLLSWTK